MCVCVCWGGGGGEQDASGLNLETCVYSDCQYFTVLLFFTCFHWFNFIFVSFVAFLFILLSLF